MLFRVASHGGGEEKESIRARSYAPFPEFRSLRDDLDHRFTDFRVPVARR